MRFLLDSDVISEPLKERPNSKVIEKLDRHSGSMVTASTVLHELRYGAALLPHSRRRARIETYLERVASGTIPVLPYGTEAAEWHALERARLQLAGKSVALADGQIAAVAKTNDLILVTRNVKHFSRFQDLQVVSWHQ